MFDFGESGKRRQINLGGKVTSNDKAKLLAKAKEERRLREESRKKEKSTITIQKSFRRYTECLELKNKLRIEFDNKERLLDENNVDLVIFYELVKLLVGFFTPNVDDDQKRLLTLLSLSSNNVTVNDFTCKFILMPIYQPNNVITKKATEDQLLQSVRCWPYLIVSLLKLITNQPYLGFYHNIIVDFYFTLVSLHSHNSYIVTGLNRSINNPEISYILSSLPRFGIYKILAYSLTSEKVCNDRIDVLGSMVQLTLSYNLQLQTLSLKTLISDLLTKVVLVSFIPTQAVQDTFLPLNSSILTLVVDWAENDVNLAFINNTDTLSTLLVNLMSFPIPKLDERDRFFKAVIHLLNLIDKIAQDENTRDGMEGVADEISSLHSIELFTTDKDTNPHSKFQDFISDRNLDWVLDRCVHYDLLNMNFELDVRNTNTSVLLFNYLTQLICNVPKFRSKLLNQFQRHLQLNFVTNLCWQVSQSQLFSMLRRFDSRFIKKPADIIAWNQLYLLITLLYDWLVEFNFNPHTGNRSKEYPLDSNQLVNLIQGLGVWLCQLYYDLDNYSLLLDVNFDGSVPFTLRQLRALTTDFLRELHSNNWIGLPSNTWELNWSILKDDDFVGKVAGHMYNQYQEPGDENAQDEDEKVSLVDSVPFLIPFELRLSIFATTLHMDQDRNSQFFGFGGSVHGQPLTIRRDNVLNDGLATLNPLQHKLKSKVTIALVSALGMPEVGVDGGGVFKEFLNLFIEQAFHPSTKLFVSTASQQLYPNPDPWACKPENLQLYGFLGRIVGKALYEGILMDLHFAPFFLNLWLNHPNTLQELNQLDPQLYSGLLKLLNMDKDKIQELELDFATNVHTYQGLSTIHLIPNGNQIQVTHNNLSQYLEKVVDFKLHKQIHRQTSAFLDGLKDLIPLQWLQPFNSLELSKLLGGNDKPLDLDDLMTYVTYSGVYDAQHPQIIYLWQVIQELSDADKAAFLRFVTSCPRPPLLGFKQLDPPLCIRDSGRDDNRLPSASTCINLLKLPLYSNKEVLKRKLVYSIRAEAGFELS